MSRENSATKPASFDGQSAALPDWMKFPALSAAFESSPSATIAYLEAKQREYESLQAGASGDRIRARLIAASYARTRALVQEIEAAQARLQATGNKISDCPITNHESCSEFERQRELRGLQPGDGPD